MNKAAKALAGAVLLLGSGCAAVQAPQATPSASVSPAPQSTATSSPTAMPTPTPTATASSAPEPSASPATKLLMSNRAGGEIIFSADFCTATVPITWYPLISTEVVTGTATIEITGPGDIAGITTVESDSNEVHLVVDFPLGKDPRSWNVDLLQVGDRLVAPAPADAKGSRYSFTGPGGNCPP